MSTQSTIILVTALAIIIIVLLFIKNNRDRKKLIRPGEGSDPVNEQHADAQQRRDKV